MKSEHLRRWRVGPVALECRDGDDPLPDFLFASPGWALVFPFRRLFETRDLRPGVTITKELRAWRLHYRPAGHFHRISVERPGERSWALVLNGFTTARKDRNNGEIELIF
jgi:hypothetical protein